MYGEEKPTEQKISKKKLFFPVNEQLRQYLDYYGRGIELPVKYDDLMPLIVQYLCTIRKVWIHFGRRLYIILRIRSISMRD